MTTTCPSCVFNDDKTELISAPTNAEIVIIPSLVETIFGSDENHNAFNSSRSTLTSFSFESDSSSLLHIQSFAFYNCFKLETINLSCCKKLTTISESAFDSCASVTKLLLPISGSLKTIGEKAFQKNSIQELFIPNTITSFGRYVFDYNSKLSKVTFEPNINLTNLPGYFIGHCNDLKTFTVPKSVTSMNNFIEGSVGITEYIVEEGNPVFYSFDCAIYEKDNKTLRFVPAGLTGTYSITINITTINIAAFMYSRIEHVEIPSTVTNIQAYSFYGSYIREINFPPNLQSIGEYAFATCRSLKNITIPEGVTSIGASAFQSCSSLIDVQLPVSLKSLGGGAFKNCHSNISIHFKEGSEYLIDENLLITDQNVTKLIMYLGSEEIVEIPKTIKKIMENAFSSSTTVREFHFIENCPQLTQIGYFSFYSCDSLQAISLPPSVKTIEYSAFENCKNLEEITISSPLTSIRYKCFNLCNKLKKIIIQSTASYKIEYSVFENIPLLQTVSLSEGLTTIGESCFKNCPLLSSITIPSTVETIDSDAFSMTSLQKITFTPQSHLIVRMQTYGYIINFLDTFWEVRMLLCKQKVNNFAHFLQCPYQ